MSTFQIKDADDTVVADGFSGTFEEANMWAIEQDLEPGWTLFEHAGGQWTPARHDPTGDDGDI